MYSARRLNIILFSTNRDQTKTGQSAKNFHSINSMCDTSPLIHILLVIDCDYLPSTTVFKLTISVQLTRNVVP